MSWLVETLASSGMLMLAVLALRVPVRRAWGAGAAYALWLIPAARVVLPPIGLPQALPTPSLDVMPTVVAAGMVAADSVDSAWPTVLLTVWAAGAIGFLAWQALAYRLFVGRALVGAIPAGRLNGVALLRSPGVDGPVAIGFRRRSVLVPADFDTRYAPEERVLALRHEAAHHARLDLWANAAALLLVALHWPNPLAHWAYRLFRADQELA